MHDVYVFSCATIVCSHLTAQKRAREPTKGSDRKLDPNKGVIWDIVDLTEKRRAANSQCLEYAHY